jgi:hypothetical protein
MKSTYVSYEVNLSDWEKPTPYDTDDYKGLKFFRRPQEKRGSMEVEAAMF